MAYYDHINIRRILTGASTTALLIVWLGTAAASDVATILASDLNVRSGPGMRQPVVFRLNAQTRVSVLERQQEWLKIDHNGRCGFIVNSPKFVRIESIDSGQQHHTASVNRSGQTQLKKLQREVETLQEKLKTSQGRLNETIRKEQNILDEVNAVEQALDSARGQVRTARVQLDTLQEKASAIQQQYGLLEKEIQSGEAYTAQRLVALYKLNWMGRIQLLASAHSFYDFISRKSALERILTQDEAELSKLRNDQAVLEALLEQLNANKAEKQAAQIAFNRRIEQLRIEQARRTALLNTVRSKKELEREAVQGLRQAARELDRIIGTLEPGPDRRPSSAAPADERTHLFEASKGLLGWPVKGKIISFFGPCRDEKFNITAFKSGINIQAELGEPVRAVSDGHTIYASWFKGFGNMMIIDHGNHYYTIYAHLEEVFKVKGDRVEKGEVIATVGDSGSLVGPALHFEVRHHGKPVDPLQWINKG